MENPFKNARTIPADEVEKQNQEAAESNLEESGDEQEKIITPFDLIRERLDTYAASLPAQDVPHAMQITQFKEHLANIESFIATHVEPKLKEQAA